MKKLQLLVAVETQIKREPDKAVRLSMYPKNIDDSNVVVEYDGNGMMRVQEIHRRMNRVKRFSPWTNDFRVLEAWISHAGLEMAEYKPHPRKGSRKSIWAYINNQRTFDVVELALAASVTVDEMKKKLKQQFPDVVFKVEIA